MRRYGGATSFLLKVRGSYRFLGDNIVFESAGYACFTYRHRALSLNNLPFHRRFLRPTTAMVRKKVTGDELNARAKEDGYRRGVYRDGDSLRDQNKHVDKIGVD